MTEENIQSRIRGNLLMALSNKFGSLLLTTGNKSEMAVGYCTAVRRYEWRPGGDCGPAEDDGVPGVALAQRGGEATFPEEISPRRPRRNCGRIRQTRTACRPTSAGSDMQLHVERASRRRRSLRGASIEDAVRQRVRLVRIAEFKRKQAAPVLKVTSRAFGTGWRMPVARADWENQAKPAKLVPE